MNKIILVVIFGLFSSLVHAVDDVGKEYIDELVQSDPVGIMRAAKGIFVGDLIGAPTNSTDYATGKNFNRFNFSRTDISRITLLYRGQGRVVFSRGGYDKTYRVIGITINSNETGYP